MASRRKVVAGVVLAGLLLTTGSIFAQTSAPSAEATGAPASRQATSVLSVVPADAWGVVGLNNMDQLDREVGRLGERLGLPMLSMVNLSGVIQMGLGITQGFNPAGGMALIVLDGTKYPGAASWAMAQGLPFPVVLALATTNSKALIQSLDGKPSDEGPNVSSVTLQGQSVFAVTKDGYVLIGPDAGILKSLVATGAAATQPAAQALKPGLVKDITGSNLFIYINARPVLATYGPMIKGVMAFGAAAMQRAERQVGAGIAGHPAALAAMVDAYIDIFSKQSDKILVFANLQADGLHLSSLVTFQPDSLLAKAFAAVEPSGKPLLAGLPDGAFILAVGQEPVGAAYAQQVTDLFLQPYITALRASEDPALIAQAEQQEKMAAVRVQLVKLQKSVQLGVYQASGGQEGMLSAVWSSHWTDAPKAYSLVKQNVKSQVDAMAAQNPKFKQFLESVIYTPEAETVDGAKVDTILLDVAQLSKAFQMPADKAAELFKVIRLLLGSDGVKVRVAVTDKIVLATLGGGDAFLKDALQAARSGKAPLATQPAVVKVTDRLPRERVNLLLLSAENLLHVADRVGRAVADEGLPFKVGPTSAPLAVAMISDPLGVHLTLYVPTDLAVSVKGMYEQAQAAQHPSDGSQPADEEAPMPAPEF